MEYPLIVEGQELGKLNVEKEGLFTVFEAQSRMCDGLLRLSVYGQGQEAYLGLMQPWSGGLYLKRKLSRSQLRGFPEKIEYAAPAGLVLPEIKAVEAPAAESPLPKPQSMGDSTLTWFRRSDGSLVSHDGKTCLVALPAKLREAPPRAVLREIDGLCYMLFRY